jgi:hypothetical protein
MVPPCDTPLAGAIRSKYSSVILLAAINSFQPLGAMPWAARDCGERRAGIQNERERRGVKQGGRSARGPGIQPEAVPREQGKRKNIATNE